MRQDKKGVRTLARLRAENERNGPRALRAFKAKHQSQAQFQCICIFELGKLWIVSRATGAVWSVDDAVGGGFEFKLFSEGR